MYIKVLTYTQTNNFGLIILSKKNRREVQKFFIPKSGVFAPSD
jgi:hypothetical protein